VQQHVVKRFTALQGCGNKNTQVVCDACLTLEIGKREGPQLLFQVSITGKRNLFSEIELLVLRFIT
jgi:hypothetical protein